MQDDPPISSSTSPSFRQHAQPRRRGGRTRPTAWQFIALVLALLWASAASAQGPVEAIDSQVGLTRHEALMASLTIFVLAVFVGFEVITKVPPTLHTPLMSGSNAISGITLVGALLVAGTGENDVACWLGALAVTFATVNVVGGFCVTHRMLSMFKRK